MKYKNYFYAILGDGIVFLLLCSWIMYLDYVREPLGTQRLYHIELPALFAVAIWYNVQMVLNFLIGLFLMVKKGEKKKLGEVLMLIGAFGLLIGWGTCFASMVG
jgi:hypothetical protein